MAWLLGHSDQGHDVGEPEPDGTVFCRTCGRYLPLDATEHGPKLDAKLIADGDGSYGAEVGVHVELK